MSNAPEFVFDAQETAAIRAQPPLATLRDLAIIEAPSVGVLGASPAILLAISDASVYTVRQKDEQSRDRILGTWLGAGAPSSCTWTFAEHLEQFASEPQAFALVYEGRLAVCAKAGAKPSPVLEACRRSLAGVWKPSEVTLVIAEPVK